jgi:hypothetical protein
LHYAFLHNDAFCKLHIILTGTTGDLGRSLHYKTSNGETVIYSDLPYAKAYNESTSNHNVVIPKHQFMGNSIVVDFDKFFPIGK